MNDSFQQPGQWHNLILTPEHRPTTEPKTHVMSYTLKNLHPGGYYEAIVQAKNRYGWNEVRYSLLLHIHILLFTLQHKGIDTKHY